MDRATLRRLIETAAGRIIAESEALTVLDQAIGDGDHGLNMRRGFEAVLAEIDPIAAKPLPEALKQIGMTLVMKVGGASGPLYGTLFSELGKALPEDPDLAALAGALAAAIEKVRARGKSEPGQKTMLDVLIPVQAALAEGRPGEIRAVAEAAAAGTVPLRAIRGRASFLGDRSIGHMDPGARSSQILIAAIADVLEGRA